MTSLSPQDQDLVARLNRHPLLKARFESLLAIAEDAGGDTSTGSVHRLVKAAEAEQRVIEEVRQMGNDVLSNWAESRVEKAAAELVAGGDVVSSGKKTPLAHDVRQNRGD
jgi:hypothetical protein